MSQKQFNYMRAKAIERNVKKKIAHWFDKHLKADYKADKPSKNAIKALDQFNQLLQGESDNDEI